jgi:predicted enzyme involved in methoxymalonyl-ACP biosynthesis
LISVIIGRVEGRIFALDTWLMSCRVLNRQVEEETMNEIVRLARLRGCDTVRGTYAATPKNHLVRELYPRMGFLPETEEPGRAVYRLETGSYRPFATKIKIGRRTHE